MKSQWNEVKIPFFISRNSRSEIAAWCRNNLKKSNGGEGYGHSWIYTGQYDQPMSIFLANPEDAVMLKLKFGL